MSVTMARAAESRPAMAENLVLGCILVLGAGLRFHDLGVPSMWWDEILVPLIARFPVGSILEWLRVVEVHPPLYYLLQKGVMALDTSDHALRLWSAVPGVVSIYVIHRIGKDLFGPLAGLGAAALLAANPYAVWLSRIVRPYGLFLMLFLLSLWALETWMRKGSRRALWAMLACNLALYWTHYMMVVLAPAFCLAVLARSWPRLKDFWLASAATVASFLTILPFFLQNFSRPHWLGPGSPLDILAGVAANTAKLAWFFGGPPAWCVLGLAGLGAAVAAARQRGALGVGLAVAAVPVAAVMAGKLAWTHEPRYFLYILPLVLLGAGLGLSTLAGAWRVAASKAGLLLPLALCAGFAGLLLSRADSFYRERSLLGIDWISYKSVARMVPLIVGPGEPAMVSEDGLANALDWYIENRPGGREGPNPLRVARLDPDRKESILNFLWFERMGHLAATREELAAAFPGLVDVGTVDKLTFLKAVVPRSPATVLAVPGEKAFKGPLGFIGECHAMENLALTPFWGGELRPAANGLPGFVEFMVENASQTPDPVVELAVRFVNEGRGNVMKVMARFDDGPWAEAARSPGPDPHFYRRVFLDPGRPFRRLQVRVEMDCAMETARYPGGNLDSLRLKEVLVAFAPRT